MADRFGRDFVHGFSRAYLTSLPLRLLLLFAAFLAGAVRDWLLLVAPVGVAGTTLLVAHLSRPKPVVVAALRWELKAPNPAAGQCPVCGLEDLDERAVGDDLLGDAGTALARVVPYGPDRAHSECATVVPWVKPQYAQGGLVPTAVEVCSTGNRARPCRCRECERQRPGRARSGYVAGDVPVSGLGLLPGSLTRPGIGAPVINNTLRDSIDVSAEWRGFGVESFAEVQDWRRHGFTPDRARAWIRSGFATPREAEATGFRWPNQLRAANGWPPFEPESEEPDTGALLRPAAAPGHVAFTMNGVRTYCACGECESLRR